LRQVVIIIGTVDGVTMKLVIKMCLSLGFV